MNRPQESLAGFGAVVLIAGAGALLLLIAAVYGFIWLVTDIVNAVMAWSPF